MKSVERCDKAALRVMKTNKTEHRTPAQKVFNVLLVDGGGGGTVL